MTTILVVSDSHGETDLLQNILDKTADDIDRVIHLGDGFRDMIAFRGKITKLDMVLGNMDSFLHLSPDLPDNSLFLEIDGVKTLAAHGHQFRVHNTMKELAREARRIRAGLVLFGHTHSPFLEEANGAVFFNPGAVKFGSYGIVTLDTGKVVSAAHYIIR